MPETKIDRHNLIAQIRAHFPELEESYQRECEKWEEDESLPTNYIIVGDVLQPYFIRELERGETSGFLRRCAAFMESVCLTGDAEAINVIWVRLFEWLIFHPRELEMIWASLGPATKSNIRDAARRWSEAGRDHGRTGNLPEKNVPDWD